MSTKQRDGNQYIGFQRDANNYIRCSVSLLSKTGHPQQLLYVIRDVDTYIKYSVSLFCKSPQQLLRMMRSPEAEAATFLFQRMVHHLKLG